MSKENSKGHKCPHDGCTWEFSCLSKLHRHLASHSTQKDFKCTQCERRFKTAYNVQYHVRTVHLTREKPYPCPVNGCNVHCTSTTLLHGHCREAHPDERLYSCTSPSCYSTFLHKDDLLVHQHVHKPAGNGSDAEAFTCDFCQKVLPSKSKLRRHRLFHIGEKHFRCPIKGSSPWRGSSPNIDRVYCNCKSTCQSHNCPCKKTGLFCSRKCKCGTKKNSCKNQDCGHAYFTKQHLSRHLERGDHLNGGILQCPGCSRVFLQPSLLHCHSVVHCPTSFTCPFKSCAGTQLGSEDDYRSHLISIHKDSQWHSCGITNCYISYPTKELQSLHHLLGHKYSSTTLKDLSLIMYSKNDKRHYKSFNGSKDDYAIIRLIVRLYPILRSFSISNFDPYLASITLFNNTSVTCEQLDRMIHSLSLSEIESEAATKSDVRGASKSNQNISTTSFQYSAFPNSLTQQVSEQYNQPCSVDAGNLGNATIAGQQAETDDIAHHRPALLSMPLLTDLQPTGNTDHITSSDNSQSSNELEGVVNNNEVSTLPSDETVTTDHTTSAGAASGGQEPYNMPLLDDDNIIRSPCGDAIDEVFNMAGLSSDGNPSFNGIFDPSSVTILPNDILDMSGESDCVRDLMESIDLSFLLPSDLLESPLSMLDDNDPIYSSSDPQEMPNFAHLVNPLADLTFESLTTIPDSILESTLQVMVDKSHSDLATPSPSGTNTTSRFSDSPVKNTTNNLSGKRGNSSGGVGSHEKRRKAVQLAKVKLITPNHATR